MDPSFIKDSQTHKSLVASSIKTNSFSSSRSKISECSCGISWSKDYNLYFNFQEFKNPTQETFKKFQLIIGSFMCEKLWGKYQMGYPKIDLDDNNNSISKAYNRLVNINQDLFDMKQGNKEQRLMEITDYDKFQLVNINKNKLIENDLLVDKSNCNMRANPSTVKVVCKDHKAMGPQGAKIPFHIPSILKPQLEYKIFVNNLNQPFEHVWLDVAKDGSRFIHPLENLSVFDFVDKSVNTTEPQKPPSLESTPFKLVQDVNGLRELVSKLWVAKEFAVDLEHNQYRSFQGMTCLMQISTRTEDFIVDTLKLWVYIGPYLRDIFQDPTKRKVMHGADKDILWLQRDFGIYVCNLFDTGQASRVLKMERNTLGFLLQYFCGVIANKEYQTADWRFRPLTDEMLRYAREDTHYLLYIYDLMKIRLISMSKKPKCPEALLEVYQRSYNVSMQLYQKEITTEDSFLNIYGLNAADLSAQQLSIASGLYEWRDLVARVEDESTGYVLPNKSLIEIAKHMPNTIEELCRLLKFRSPLVDLNLHVIVNIVQNSIYNASEFVEVAKRLKQERLEMEASTSANLGGSSNIVTSQFKNNAAGKMKVDAGKKEGTKAKEMERHMNISFGSFASTSNQSLPLDMKKCAKVQEPPNNKEPSTTRFKPVGGVVLRESGSGIAVATSEDKKNLDKISSSFKNDCRPQKR